MAKRYSIIICKILSKPSSLIIFKKPINFHYQRLNFASSNDMVSFLKIKYMKKKKQIYRHAKNKDSKKFIKIAVESDAFKYDKLKIDILKKINIEKMVNKINILTINQFYYSKIIFSISNPFFLNKINLFVLNL